VLTSDDAVAKRVNCAIDPCHAFWTGRDEDSKPFAAMARALGIHGAVLNVQLDRIDGIIEAMRRERDTILTASAKRKNSDCARRRSIAEFDCGTNVFLTLPNAEAATLFVQTFPSVIAGKTGRHTYTEWDQVLMAWGGASLMNRTTCRRMPSVAEPIPGHVRAIAGNPQSHDSRPDTS